MKRPRYFCTRLPTCGRGFELSELDYELCSPQALQCPDCGAPVFDVWAPWLELMRPALFVLSAAAVALVLALLLTGCAGAPFTAGEALALDQGGAGGEETPMNQAGAAIASAGGGQSVQGSSGSSAIGDAGGAPAALCELAGATATAFAAWTSGDGGPPSSAVDGSSSTRWASGVPQAPGQWFDVTLAAPLELERLALVSRASDVPAAVALELDGVAVPATLSSSPGVVALDFAPQRASTIRLELEQASNSWWSIDEIKPGCP
jgi:hypothetical protein